MDHLKAPQQGIGFLIGGFQKMDAIFLAYLPMYVCSVSRIVLRLVCFAAIAAGHPG
jgi:hypothetical protein